MSGEGQPLRVPLVVFMDGFNMTLGLAVRVPVIYNFQLEWNTSRAQDTIGPFGSHARLRHMRGEAGIASCSLRHVFVRAMLSQRARAVHLPHKLPLQLDATRCCGGPLPKFKQFMRQRNDNCLVTSIARLTWGIQQGRA